MVLLLPGMVLHEFSHVLACLFTGVKVHEVKWVGTSEAFVKHDKPGAFSGLVISLAPFVLGNLLGFWFLQQAIHSFSSDFAWAVLFLWFGASMVLLSFPSLQDSQNTWQAVADSYHKKLSGKNSLTAKFVWLVSAPFVFIPLSFLLAVFLLFNYLFVLRIGWVIGFLTLAGA
jgi:hypothetical protein